MRKMAVFTNQATLSYNGITVNSNVVTGNIVEVLSVSKTAVPQSYALDDVVTYIVSIINSGTAPVTGVTVTDNLGAYAFGTVIRTPLDYVTDSVVYYQNGVLQAAPTVADNQPLTVTGITIPANGNTTLIYQARVNEFAPPGAEGTITNGVSVTASELINPVTAEETITTLDEPVLTITKGLSPVNVTENSALTYTFTVQNFGNTEAAATDSLVIRDTFDPILSDIAVTVNGATLPVGDYTYNEATGEFETVIGSVTVPAATFVQDPTSGAWTVVPGTTVVTVTGTV